MNPIYKELETDDFLDCIHCGLCLSSCPTYALLGNEADSPRGRIYLMRALVEGKIGYTENTIKHLDSCLECRACETACPSGVGYGELLENTRNEIEKNYERPVNEKKLRDLILNKAITSDKFLHFSHKLNNFLDDFPFILELTKKIVPQDAQEILKKIPQANEYHKLNEFYPAKKTKRFSVVLLEGCVAKYFFSKTNAATIQVLTENGCDVWVPKKQNCCGSLHNHNGELETAHELANQNAEIFTEFNPDFIATNSAGCGSFMKEFGLHSSSEATQNFSKKVRDITELLVEIDFRKPSSELNLNVAYHDACHLAHGQKVTSEPREILNSIEGLELVPFKENDFCCGSAGIYNVLQPELAEMLLDRKITNLPTHKIDLVATGNPGCTLQIQNGLKNYGIEVGVVHPIEILAKAYSLEK
ncbi:MAG: (Fe-S)-binding protein [Calditrichaeota bacterium]|nr:MAG: (Fe-S)-binding protein [Calditrichota bacterium]